MEMEQSRPEVSKKLWGLVRAVLYMMRKGFCKSKIIVDLHLMLKRGKIASKAIGELMHHHYASFTCRSGDAQVSFISPREYEFSCSNSPAYGYLPFTSSHTKFGYKRNKHNHNYSNYHRQLAKSSYRCDEAATISAVQKVLEMLNAEAAAAEATATAAPSPFVLPGFGKSPMVRQLRITDSPFPLKDDGDNGEVDVAAEEFIKKFYKDLKLQKSTVGLDSPYYGTWGR